MHGLSFGVKRAHLRNVEVLKKIVREFGLTPARFDVMYVLWVGDGGREQSELWTLLGVSRQTMSKMLKGMEEKGLVWREEDADDQRRRSVTLTKVGLERFVEAAKVVFRTEKLRRKFDAMHQEGRAFVENAWNVVKHVGKALGDTARHYYSIHAPDAVRIAAADRLTERARNYVQRVEPLRPKDPVDIEDDDPEALTEFERKLIEQKETWDPRRLRLKLMTIEMFALKPVISSRELRTLLLQMR